MFAPAAGHWTKCVLVQNQLGWISPTVAEKGKRQDEKLQNFIESVANSLRKKDIISVYIFGLFLQSKAKEINTRKNSLRL